MSYDFPDGPDFNPEPQDDEYTGHEGDVHRGRCYSCGDEWSERDSIEICPECHSRDVAELAA